MPGSGNAKAKFKNLVWQKQNGQKLVWQKQKKSHTQGRYQLPHLLFLLQTFSTLKLAYKDYTIFMQGGGGNETNPETKTQKKWS